jgi:hypothetical protein
MMAFTFYFLNNPSEQTLQDERILKRKEFAAFYLMISDPLPP